MTARASLDALGTTCVLVVDDAEALVPGLELLELLLADVDLAFSRFRPDSELMRVNASAGSDTDISPLFATGLRAALDAAHATGGLVDPCLGAQLRAAGYDRTFELVQTRDGWAPRPPQPAADAWRRVELDVEACVVRLPAGVELDLGATAKAGAADAAATAIAVATETGVLVSLGGDLAVAGRAPDTGWPVLIADDHRARLDGDGPVVSISAGGLATSSSGVRRWRSGDGEAHHLLDPRTGASASTPWRTVSVAARTCVDANTAATAAHVLGESAPAWLAERELPARLVRNDGTVVLAGAWPAKLRAA